MNSHKAHLNNSALYALVSSLAIVSMLFAGFFMMEPALGHGQSFQINQTITSESSLTVSDVTMVGALAGITGGNATGTTDVVITSNNAAGYNVTIAFADVDADGSAMNGNETDTGELRNYVTSVSDVPDYDFNASSSALFSYTVDSDANADTDPSFLSNGSNTCNTGSNPSAGATCWMEPKTAAFTIINTADSAPTGATSTLTFKVHVPNAAVPVPQAQIYTATATLTLGDN